MTDPYRGPGGQGAAAGSAGWGPGAPGPSYPPGPSYSPGPGSPPYQQPPAPQQGPYPPSGPAGYLPPGYPPPGAGPYPPPGPVGYPPAAAPAPLAADPVAPSPPGRTRSSAPGVLDLGRTLLLAVVVLAILNVIWGFLPAYGSAEVGATVPVLASTGAYAPVLLLIAGLVAAGTFLPGCRRNDYLTAALSTVGAAGALATFLLGQPPLSAGAILLLIFGAAQAVAAIGVLVLGYRGRGEAGTDAPVSAVPAGATTVGPASDGRPQPHVPVAGVTSQSPGWPPAPTPPAAAIRPAGPSAPGTLVSPPEAPAGAAPGAIHPDADDGDDPEATRFVRF